MALKLTISADAGESASATSRNAAGLPLAAPGMQHHSGGMMGLARWMTTVLAASIAFPAAELHAQSPGTIELGGFARITRFDDDIRLDPQPGGGAMLAYLVGNNLALELATSFGSSESSRPAGGNGSYLPVSLLLVLRDSLSARTDLLWGIGMVRNHYGQDYDTYEYGGSVMAGARRHLTQWVALRGATQMDLMASPSSGSTADFNFTLQLGVDVQLNRVPPRDSDFDGVADRFDRCPRTPSGVDVDRDGCPLAADADVDGVPDVQDRCPNTPLGTAVDATGCPRFPGAAGTPPPPRTPPVPR